MARIIFCECANREFVTVEKRQAVKSALKQQGVPFLSVPDLCGLAAGRDPSLSSVLEREPVTVVACHPRAVQWMLRWMLGDRSPAELTVINLRSLDAASAAEQVCRSGTGPEAAAAWSLAAPALAGVDAPASVCAQPCSDRPDCPAADGGATPTGAAAWEPWYPVIDYGRCRQCGQCAGFCLFGVYELTEAKQVRVARPASCKNNCPACARLCPEAAIIFPKCPESPINGAEIQDESAVRAMVKVNVDQILGSDPYAALQARKQKRQRLFKEQAFAERRQALDASGSPKA